MTTQPRVASLIRSAACAFGSARLMMEVSSTTISVAAAITVNAHHRRGSADRFPVFDGKLCRVVKKGSSSG